MLANETLQKFVIDELAWDPRVDSSDIAVTVHDGTVRLAGHVNSYAAKLAAERAAGRVKGTKAVVDNIDVRFEDKRRSDEAIADRAVAALEWNVEVPHDKVKVVVNKGWLKLEGEVSWYFQKEAAERTVRQLRGVKAVTNYIVIKPNVAPAVVREHIESALKRSAEVDASLMRIQTEGGKVILSGFVRSWAERKAAERAAWSSPGVSSVQNDLVVEAPIPISL